MVSFAKQSSHNAREVQNKTVGELALWPRSQASTQLLSLAVRKAGEPGPAYGSIHWSHNFWQSKAVLRWRIAVNRLGEFTFSRLTEDNWNIVALRYLKL